MQLLWCSIAIFEFLLIVGYVGYLSIREIWERKLEPHESPIYNNSTNFGVFKKSHDDKKDEYKYRLFTSAIVKGVAGKETIKELGQSEAFIR